MAKAIEVDHFSKKYRTGIWSKPFDAVHDLSFSVNSGSVIGFLGPNGAGKTTTIGAILGLLTPSGGQIRVFGEEPNAATVRPRIGHVSEVHPSYPSLTAKEQLTFLGRLSNISESQLSSRVEEVLSQVQLEDTGKKIAKTFSKGMTQRLGLAQALLHKPELLILDEPTTGLDPEGRHLFMDIVREEAKSGHTVFFSTHILTDVEELCDKVIIIKGGQLIKELDLSKRAGDGGWEISFSDPSGKAKLLLQEAQLKVVPSSTGVLVVTLSESEKSKMLSRLVEAGADIHSMNQRAESIEQVYLSLVGSGNNESN